MPKTGHTCPRLNPLFGGSAFRTTLGPTSGVSEGLNPLFGGSAFRTGPKEDIMAKTRSLNPLFGGSAFRTDWPAVVGGKKGLNPLFGGSAFRTKLAAVIATVMLS